MSFVAVAVGAAVVGGAIYMNVQQKKAMGAQGKAMREAQAADRRDAAAAEASAAAAANQTLADKNRRRRASALSAGAADQALGATSVLGAGSQPVSVASKSTSALGRGAG